MNLDLATDSIETKARLNYLVDVLRGCWMDRDHFVPFDEMREKIQQAYREEAENADYVITSTDLQEIEEFLSKREGM